MLLDFDHDEPVALPYPVIEVNQNYMRQYKKMKLQKTEDLILIPEKYRENSQLINLIKTQHSSSSIQMISNGQTYLSAEPLPDIVSITDPIVIIHPDHQITMLGAGWYASEPQLKKFKSLSANTGLSFRKNDDSFYVLISRSQDDLVVSLIASFVYFMIIFLFQLTLILIGLIDKSQEMAIGYLCGQSHLRRHKKLYLSNLIIYIISFIYLSIQGIPSEILWILLTIDLILTYVLTTYWDKKLIPVALKKGI